MIYYKTPVLSYHSVVNDNFYNGLNVDQFEKQLSYLKKNGYSSTYFNKIQPNIKNQIIFTFDDGYKDIISNALPLLKKYNFKAICYIVSNHIGKYNTWDKNTKNYHNKELMNNYDINEWLMNGMMIGSHSHNHHNLTKLNNKELEIEISSSKKILEDKFSHQIDNFCYPYGKYNLNSYKKVKKIYVNAVTTNRSRYNISKHDRFLIPRIDMGKNLNKFKIFLKLKTIYEDIKYNEVQLHL